MELNNWKTFLEELADPDKINVGSLHQKDKLNSKFWDVRDKLDSEVSDVLYSIAKEFFQSLKLDPRIKMKDVTLTGSIASYNWSNASDVDLHILLNFNDLDNIDLLKDYFKEKTINWNNRHKIFIKGFEVEIYIQDANEPHYSLGIYSIKDNRWIKKPSKFSVKIDDQAIKRKASNLMEQIDDIYDDFAEHQYRTAKKNADRLMKKIKKYRRSGLEKDGVYSVENLVFKVLRRNDYLGKLSSLRIMSYDKTMSLGEEY